MATTTQTPSFSLSKTRLPLRFGSRFQIYPFGKGRVDSLSKGRQVEKIKVARTFQFCRDFHLMQICKTVFALCLPLKGYEGVMVLGGTIPMFLHHCSLSHPESLLIMEERCGYHGSPTFLLFTLIPSPVTDPNLFTFFIQCSQFCCVHPQTCCS